MTMKVERLLHEPIIVVTWFEPTDVQKETPGKFTKIDALIGPDEKVYVIDDLSKVKLDFSTLVAGMSAQRTKAPGSPSDPRIKTTLIGSGFFVELISKGAKQFQYGSLDIPLFTSLDEALAHAREKIKSW
jgi:hypothetical protein